MNLLEWVAVGLVAFDVLTVGLNALLHQRTYIKGAERARNLIMGDKMFSDTRNRLVSLDDSVKKIHDAAARAEIMSSQSRGLVEGLRQDLQLLPGKISVETLKADINFQISQLKISMENALRENVTQLKNSIPPVPVMPVVPTAEQIAYKVANDPHIEEIMRSSINGQVGQLIKESKTAMAANPAMSQAIYDQYYNMLSPLLGEVEADRVAFSISSAPPMLRDPLIKALEKRLKSTIGGWA